MESLCYLIFVPDKLIMKKMKLKSMKFGVVLLAASLTVGTVSCKKKGCTDPTAVNYNADATVDDGTCIFDYVIGCTDATAINYNAEAVSDDGSCFLFDDVMGEIFFFICC